MPELRRILWGAAGAGAAVALVAGVALASRAAIGAPARGSELRLALRAAHARLETCRERSDEELAELPAHFRLRRDCEEVAIDYLLTVTVDGERRIDRLVSHSGVRRTRPLTVDEAIPVASGSHRVELTFLPVAPAKLGRAGEREGSGDDEEEEREDPEDDSGLRRDAFAALPAARFADTIDFRAGRIELVVLDESGSFRRADGGERRD